MARWRAAARVAKLKTHTPEMVSSPAKPNHHAATNPRPNETSNIPKVSSATIRSSWMNLNGLISPLSGGCVSARQARHR
jgi:hypothetical protein